MPDADREIPTLGSTENAGNEVNLASRSAWETDVRFYLCAAAEALGLLQPLGGKYIRTLMSRTLMPRLPWLVPTRYLGKNLIAVGFG